MRFCDASAVVPLCADKPGSASARAMLDEDGSSPSGRSSGRGPVPPRRRSSSAFLRERLRRVGAAPFRKPPPPAFLRNVSAERPRPRLGHRAARRSLGNVSPFSQCRGVDVQHHLIAVAGRTLVQPARQHRLRHRRDGVRLLPKLSDAMRRGRISYSKVRAVTRVATPENEQTLLDVALAGTAGRVERIVRGWRRVDREVQHERRDCTSLPGRLPGLRERSPSDSPAARRSAW